MPEPKTCEKCDGRGSFTATNPPAEYPCSACGGDGVSKDGQRPEELEEAERRELARARQTLADLRYKGRISRKHGHAIGDALGSAQSRFGELARLTRELARLTRELVDRTATLVALGREYTELRGRLDVANRRALQSERTSNEFQSALDRAENARTALTARAELAERGRAAAFEHIGVREFGFAADEDVARAAELPTMSEIMRNAARAELARRARGSADPAPVRHIPDQDGGL